MPLMYVYLILYITGMHKSVEEFSVQTLELGGLGAALKALHLPFGKVFRGVVNSHIEKHCDVRDAVRYGSEVYLDPRDKKLIQTLVNNGDEHAKVLRGVVVWCEINAPRYWWQEMDRYSVGACCLASNSTMHQQGKGLVEDALIEMKENLPEGTMQKRVWMFSYQTLRRIYFQRRNHRLPQWRKFCDWIEKLPFAVEFITLDGNNSDKDK